MHIEPFNCSSITLKINRNIRWPRRSANGLMVLLLPNSFELSDWQAFQETMKDLHRQKLRKLTQIGRSGSMGTRVFWTFDNISPRSFTPQMSWRWVGRADGGSSGRSNWKSKAIQLFETGLFLIHILGSRLPQRIQSRGDKYERCSYCGARTFQSRPHFTLDQVPSLPR